MIKQWNLLVRGILRTRDATVDDEGRRHWRNFDPPDLEGVPANERRTVVTITVTTDDNAPTAARVEVRKMIRDVLQAGIDRSALAPLTASEYGVLSTLSFSSDRNDEGYSLLEKTLAQVECELGA